MKTYRQSFTETGNIIARRISRNVAAQVGRRLNEGRADSREAVPSGFLTLYDREMAVLADQVPALEQATILRPQSPHDPIPASEAVEALITAPVQLTNPVMFNQLLDRYVRAVDDCLRSSMVGPEQNPRVAASAELHNHLFSEGRRFLTTSNLRQWHHIDVHFNQMSQDNLALATAAGAREAIENVRVLNAHFGLMLGVARDDLRELVEDHPLLDDDPNNDNIPAIHAAILQALTNLLLLAHLAFPSPDQSAERRRIVGPYLDAIAEDSAVRARRVRDSNNDTIPQPSPQPA